jgi:predicted Rossmann fold nucleotide-binding protein DprA/Smf involved in DNA uptake
MQRNKLIYALADAALVMSSDLKKGGTWAGATEQLDKFRIIPVYVRLTAEHSPGIDALHKKGAIPWPNPKTVDEFESIFTAAPQEIKSAKSSMGLLFSDIRLTETKSVYLDTNNIQSIPDKVQESLPQIMQGSIISVMTDKRDEPPYVDSKTEPIEFNPAKKLFSVIQEMIEQLLKTSKSEADIADALDITKAQAHAWLKRLLEEDKIEKLNKPVRYRLKQPGLFQEYNKGNSHGNNK